MINTNKKISVIMGIYNCEKTLAEAIDSLLLQTYTNWELILCDDGSKDRTLFVANEYVEKYPDKIKLLQNEQNMGLNFTLNKCLEEAQGEYIARMDGDDISLPQRFEKEIDILENNKEISIVSTAMILFDEEGDWGNTKVIETPVKRDLLYRTPFCHAACLVRREAYLSVCGYSEGKRLLRVEDYHLWLKMYAKGFKGLNLQEALYKMRDDRNAQHRKKFKYRINEAYVKAYAIKSLGLPFYSYIYCLKPILLGLLPGFMYKWLHRRKRSKIRKR